MWVCKALDNRSTSVTVADDCERTDGGRGGPQRRLLRRAEPLRCRPYERLRLAQARQQRRVAGVRRQPELRQADQRHRLAGLPLGRLDPEPRESPGRRDHRVYRGPPAASTSSTTSTGPEPDTDTFSSTISTGPEPDTNTFSSSETTATTGCFDAGADGVCDEIDNCPDDANPLQEDGDGDLFGDACDACPGLADDQADGDGDLVGDVCDVCPDVQDGQADGDGDLVGDACDVCPGLEDDLSDGDGDLFGDVCDVCPDVQDDQVDLDGDSLGDACDLCPLVADPDQPDADMDAIGDECDPCAFDGPAFMLPNPAVYPDEVTIADAFFTATISSVITVKPGEPIQLQFDWTLKSCPCPGCINQGYVAVPSETTVDCYYSGGPPHRGRPARRSAYYYSHRRSLRVRRRVTRTPRACLAAAKKNRWTTKCRRSRSGLARRGWIR